jgi:hypothetical protein
MEEENNPFSPDDLEEIPLFFHCTVEKKPFLLCSYCEKILHENHYIIEKLMQGNEPMVEFALCNACIEGLIASLSKESLENMRKNKEPFLFTPGDHCISCKKTSKEVKRSIHVGMFFGNKHVSDSHVWTCSDCIKEKQKLLSKKTRERLGDFNRDILAPFNSGVDLNLLPF